MSLSHWTTRHPYRHCLGKPRRRRSLARDLRRQWPKLLHGDAEGDYFVVHLRLPLPHEFLVQTNDFPEFKLPLRRPAALLHRQEGKRGMIDIAPSTKIHSLETYLGEQCGTIKGHERTSRSTSSIVENEDGSLAIRTLDVLHAKTRIPASWLLRIDVEGHEPRIIRGGSCYLSGCLPCLHLKWHPNMLKREGEPPEAPLDLLAGLGCADLLVYDNSGYLLTPFALSDAGLRERLSTCPPRQAAFHFNHIAFTSPHSDHRLHRSPAGLPSDTPARQHAIAGDADPAESIHA